MTEIDDDDCETITADEYINDVMSIVLDEYKCLGEEIDALKAVIKETSTTEIREMIEVIDEHAGCIVQTLIDFVEDYEEWDPPPDED